MITKALVIDEPWISKILRGEKTWEMRSSKSGFRGPFGLIRKGSGNVVGIARLKAVSGPYSNRELEAHVSHHQVGRAIVEQPGYKWRYAWELADVVSLDRQVPYIHKNGAVTWVELDADASLAIEAQFDDSAETREMSQKVDMEMARLFGDVGTVSQIPVEQQHRLMVSAATTCESPVVSNAPLFESRYTGAVPNVRTHQTGGGAALADQPLGFVPQARDGTRFMPDLRNAKGLYTVGDKGDEKKFSDYHLALAFLAKMGVAKWRRPNAQGNWGIVSAVGWVTADNRKQ